MLLCFAAVTSAAAAYGAESAPGTCRGGFDLLQKADALSLAINARSVEACKAACDELGAACVSVSWWPLGRTLYRTAGGNSMKSQCWLSSLCTKPDCCWDFRTFVKRDVPASKPLLAVLPVHPPKFELLLAFLRSVEACAAPERSAMHFVLIFSPSADRELFSQLARGPASQASGSNESVVVRHLVLDMPLPLRREEGVGVSPPAWKKWYGLAMLLDASNHGGSRRSGRRDDGRRDGAGAGRAEDEAGSLAQMRDGEFRDTQLASRRPGARQGWVEPWMRHLRRTYEHAVLIDAETAVISCAALGSLPSRVALKDSGRTWGAAGNCVDKMINRTRAAALIAAETPHELQVISEATKGALHSSGIR